MLNFIKSPINLRGATEDEILKIRYKPTDGGLGDCCFASDKSGFHCFYIARMYDLKADCSAPGQETAIGHGAGSDIFSISKVANAISTRKNLYDNGHVWAPSIVWADGKWQMFYTAATDKLYQTIAVGYSDDLYNWFAPEDNVVADCKDFGWAMSQANDYTDCRDPHITEYDGVWYCYYTARLKNGNACIGVCTSEDLLTWQDRGFCLERAYRNNEAMGTEMCESPCAFRKDGIYYIVYNQGMGMKYAVSDNPLDFTCSPNFTLHTGELPDNVPYNFEFLDADTGLFGYLCGGYYSYAAFGFCEINRGTLSIREL